MINQNQKLIPVIVQDSSSKEILMLAYMNTEAINKTLEGPDVWFYSKNLKERIRALVIFLIMRDVGDDTTIDSEECTEIEFPEELPEDFPGGKKRIVKTENIFIAFNAISLLFPEEEDAMMKNFLLPLKLEATGIFLDKLGKLLDKPTMTKTDKGTAKELIWKLKLIYSDK